MRYTIIVYEIVLYSGVALKKLRVATYSTLAVKFKIRKGIMKMKKM